MDLHFRILHSKASKLIVTRCKLYFMQWKVTTRMCDGSGE